MTDNPAPNPPEHERARQWRLNANLSQTKLGELTGFAQSGVTDMERGKRINGTPITEATWRRYKNACAGVMLGKDFDWG